MHLAPNFGFCKYLPTMSFSNDEEDINSGFSVLHNLSWRLKIPETMPIKSS